MVFGSTLELHAGDGEWEDDAEADVALERFMDDRLVSEEMRLQNGNVDVWLISLRYYT